MGDVERLLKDREEIIKIAKCTWTLIAPFYDAMPEVETKKDGTPVTKADKIANKFILQELRRLFPDDGIVSEESYETIKGERTWYVDPIDGTRGFFKRNAHFAIHIGLVEDKKPVMGVVYWPPVDEMYSGIKGLGAFRDSPRSSVQLKVNEANMDDLVAMIGSIYSRPPEQVKVYNELGVKKFHHNGSEGLRLVKICENRADFRMSEKDKGPNTWDLCAPQAILEAAGGRMMFLEGTEIEYTGQRGVGKKYLAAKTSKLADKIVELLNN